MELANANDHSLGKMLMCLVFAENRIKASVAVSSGDAEFYVVST